MLHMISQGGFAVTVNESGGQLVSIVNDGIEYLHQGLEAAPMHDAALHLFPVIGPAPGDGFRYNGVKYKQQNTLGLLQNSSFKVEKKDFEFLSMIFRSNEVTKAQYPFDFLFGIQYRIVGKRLAVTYEVQNQSLRDMYFSLGGQLCIKLPFEDLFTVHDYALEFPDSCAPILYDIAQDGFSVGSIAYKLVNNNRLPFDPAVVTGRTKFFTKIPSAVSIKSRTGLKGLRLRYHDMRYLGVRCVDGNDPHVVLIVSTAAPQQKGVATDISAYKDIIVLAQGETYSNEWSITVE